MPILVNVHSGGVIVTLDLDGAQSWTLDEKWMICDGYSPFPFPLNDRDFFFDLKGQRFYLREIVRTITSRWVMLGFDPAATVAPLTAYCEIPRQQAARILVWGNADLPPSLRDLVREEPPGLANDRPGTRPPGPIAMGQDAKVVERNRRAHELYERGMVWKAIAREVGLSPTGARKAAERHAGGPLTPRKGGRPRAK